MDGADADLTSHAAMAWWAHAIFAATALFAGYALYEVHGYRTVVAALLLLATLALWLANMVVRATVTESRLHVQHGLLGPRIALDDVIDAHAENVTFRHWLRAVGWGVGGRSIDGTFAFLVPGPSRAVRIRYQHRGRVRVALVSTDEPEALVAALARATARVRIVEPGTVAGAAVTEDPSVEALLRADDQPEEPLDAAPARSRKTVGGQTSA